MPFIPHGHTHFVCPFCSSKKSRYKHRNNLNDWDNRACSGAANGPVPMSANKPGGQGVDAQENPERVMKTIRLNDNSQASFKDEALRIHKNNI
jgi:hypothetical protein